jgi:NAD(P)-dependent dehydrogenase (short-subunit alcohol dehydrogenase family)
MNLAIVTGAGAGLGRALAQGLADSGRHVLVADIDADAAEETAALIGGRAVPADIRDPEECHRLVRLAVEAGGPHTLINNAGGWTPGDKQYPDAPADAWTATMTLNLIAPMLLSQLVLEPMRALGGGAIVNIASSAGAESDGYGSPEYGSSKAGLIRLTSSLAGLQESHGVRMTCIVPGWIGLERAHAQFAALAPEVRAKTPPLIPPADVVALALELIATGRSGTVVEI